MPTTGSRPSCASVAFVARRTYQSKAGNPATTARNASPAPIASHVFGLIDAPPAGWNRPWRLASASARQYQRESARRRAGPTRRGAWPDHTFVVTCAGTSVVLAASLAAHYPARPRPMLFYSHGPGAAHHAYTPTDRASRPARSRHIQELTYPSRLHASTYEMR